MLAPDKKRHNLSKNILCDRELKELFRKAFVGLIYASVVTSD